MSGFIYKVDMKRLGRVVHTGIYVRAQKDNGSFISCDIAEIDRSSLQWFVLKVIENGRS